MDSRKLYGQVMPYVEKRFNVINFNDVAAQWKEIKSSVPIDKFLSTGPYILGENVEKFEKEFSAYCGARYAVGVSSGTDALKLALQVLISNFWQSHSKTVPYQVIIPANAHISSALAPAYFKLGTTVIDCDKDHNMDLNKLKKYLDICTPPTIIIVTHMYGKPVDIHRIKEITPNSLIIEDCSHAHGATINGQHVGTIGDLGVFSLYPTKILGAFGDAGIIVTNKFEPSQHLKALRNYGAYTKDDCQNIGWNNRLDEIQALILREKLRHLDRWNVCRRTIAELYSKYLQGVGDLILPQITEGRVFHIYQVRTTKRDQLKIFLEKKNIPTLIHYPTPIYKTEEFHHLNIDPSKMLRTETYSQEILSLPIHPFMMKQDVETITAAIMSFFNPWSCIECGGHEELMGHKEEHICRWCIRKAAGETTDIINPTGRIRQT